MLNERLQHALENINPNMDESAWRKFCEWIASFHDLDVGGLKYDNFFEFDKNGEVDLPLKYFETVRDLWSKWKKATEVDTIASASLASPAQN